MKKFLYFLTEKDGRSRTVINGVVTSTSTPTPLAQAPDGNQEISIGWERSPVYYGNIRNFSLPLGFLMDGRKILANDWYKFNNDRELYLLIKRLTYEFTPVTFKEFYKQLYKGQLDFSTSADDQGGYRFNIGIMEGGTQRLLKANEGTNYEFPFDTDAKNVRMDGLLLHGVYEWIVAAYGGPGQGYPGMFQSTTENTIPGLAVFNVTQTTNLLPDSTDETYFARATQDIPGVKITGLLPGFNNAGSAGPLFVALYVFNTVSNTLRLGIELTPADPYPENYTLEIDQTIDVLAGDRLFLHTQSAFTGDGNLKMVAFSKPLDSTISGFTVYDLGRKIVERMTGSAENFQSDTLQTLNIILTSGDGVRGLANAAIKTNWRDYFKFVDSLIMAEMTIEAGIIRVEGRVRAFTPTPAVPLGEIRGLKVTAALDLLATRVKVGHADQEVDDLNGKYDFNGNMIFNTPLKAIPEKEYDIMHSYKASPYEIEHTRANYLGKTTTDKSTDNDTFVLAVLPDAASDSFNTGAVFQADGAPLAPGYPLMAIEATVPQLRPGQVIQVTGSASNDGQYSIRTAQGWIFGQLITFNEPVVDEASVPVTIEILEGQYYILDRSIAIDQLTAPDDAPDEVKASVFNVPLTPKRMLLAHAPWLAGICYNYAPGVLKFGSANRNKELIAGGIVEKADVPVADLGPPMFLPFYFEFDTTTPVDMTATLEANPNPVFSFTWKNHGYTGFFYRGGIALNDLEEQTFKLLACPDNNLLLLI